MSKAYSKAFKQQIIAERLKGSSCEALAKTHHIGVSTIHKWMNHYKKWIFRFYGATCPVMTEPLNRTK